MTNTKQYRAKVGVIGGSGLYHLDNLEFLADERPETPWGLPSGDIRICRHNNTNVAFLARHGKGHHLNPSDVPNRANIAALKSLGVEIILAFSAVGSLREEIRPLDFVLPSQVIDRTKGIRASTFFENGCVGHVEFADPFCEELGQLILKAWSAVFSNSAHDGPLLHSDKCLVVMEGPAFSTRAESNLYRSWGCDIINMSTLPEAKLAREAEISYQVLCMATDYDCWRVGGDDVTVDSVIANLGKNGDTAKKLLLAVLPLLESGLKNVGGGAIRKGMNKNSIITAKDQRQASQLDKLAFLFNEK
eukprot:Partr_v1_DN28696_c1_g1_i2_m50301 putative Catalyzes the reversible phosphorylation of S-methyl-5'- thioadenosine (MTA) to adenine and 5-methylthioribose-1-phosphate. Involved in the breakdown of MTA, a major by-product of polyamine biosynthesis. Responsible for the first step in the methionine salvage pathway after MTA has been generated from S- adenosylmethionine. Has broad substrate specificity with 6- aminopurine nucleosides as preferred substrates (By similarity)